MIQQVIETIINELNKETTKQQIKTFSDPIINKVMPYIYLLFTMIFLILVLTMTNTYHSVYLKSA